VSERILSISDLTITRAGLPRPELENVSLTLDAGETLLLLGESGSGIPSLMRAVMGAGQSGERVSGQIQFAQSTPGVKVRHGESALRIAYLPDAHSEVLSPHASVLSQLVRILARKLDLPRATASEELRLTLARLEGAPPLDAFRAGTVEAMALSWGFLALAIAQTPDLIVADHPLPDSSPIGSRKFTAALVAEQKRLGFALLYSARRTLVTTWLEGRIAILRNGRIVEEGTVGRLSSAQAHAYTQQLYKSLPMVTPQVPLPRRGSRGEPVLQVRGLELSPPQKNVYRARETVTFDLRRGASLAWLGEENSGRNELLRMVLGQQEPAGGRVIFDSVDVGILSQAMTARLRRRVVFIAGDDNVLDPRMNVRDTVEEPLRAHLNLSRDLVAGHCEAALKRVGLASLAPERAVAALSRFDKRRLQVARAIVTVPLLAVIDEPQRGLGPLESAVMLDLLRELRAQEGPAFLLLTANFALALALADEAMVFKDRSIVERGPVGEMLKAPKDDYTKALIAAITPVLPSGLPKAQSQG
jgi:peptide/nickel transport system ATP-binding protein